MGTVSSSQGSCAAFVQPRTIANGRQRHDQRRLHRASSTLGLQTNTVSVAVDGTNTGDTGASDDTT